MFGVHPHREHPELDLAGSEGDPVDRNPVAEQLRHRDREIAQIGRGVEPDQVGAEQALQELPPAGKDSEHVVRREWDMEEESDSGGGHQSPEQRRPERGVPDVSNSAEAVSDADIMLRVKTGDGSIDARVEPGSKLTGGWSIRTGDGSVDMVLPADLQANIDASTNDGHISLGIPVTVEGTFSNSQIHGKMNGGGQPLTIHTGDGSIRLSKSS